MKRLTTILTLLFLVLLFKNCKKDPPIPNDDGHNHTHVKITSPGFPDMLVPSDNPTTQEGIDLGRMLFYDTLLSADFTQSCGSCHSQAHAFSDNGKQFSTGVDGIAGTVNASAIINPGWLPNAFWDGRAASLEEQALGPVPNPIEMHLDWSNAVSRLNNHANYPDLFENIFESKPITKEQVTKAIAQFERTLVSNNSKYDAVLNGTEVFTSKEQAGYNLFFSEQSECFHCHATILFTDNLFHNNGLDAVPDSGRAVVTGNSNDNGKFRTPTLRNIEYTAPYMHDGSIATLEDVIDFYSSGVQVSATVDPLITNPHLGGFQFTTQQKSDLITFLKTLSDPSFISNPDFSNPF